MDEEHRKQYEEELKRQQSKHNKHDKVHHPGNKAQLEEGMFKLKIFHQHLIVIIRIGFVLFKCGKNKITWTLPISIQKHFS